MPDITMCKGDGCGIKNNCYRFRATPDRLQSYFADYKPTVDCPYFIAYRGEDGNEKGGKK